MHEIMHGGTPKFFSIKAEKSPFEQYNDSAIKNAKPPPH
jgi:hypothetical protein